MRTLTLLGGLLGLATSVAAALPPIHAFGNKFFTADGKQFFIKGVFLTLFRPVVERAPLPLPQ